VPKRPQTGYAWYYDDNAMPSHIRLCPVTCGLITTGLDYASEDGTIDILIGCQ
jgi:hypothetical protein